MHVHNTFVCTSFWNGNNIQTHHQMRNYYYHFVFNKTHIEISTVFECMKCATLSGKMSMIFKYMQSVWLAFSFALKIKIDLNFVVCALQTWIVILELYRRCRCCERDTAKTCCNYIQDFEWVLLTNSHFNSNDFRPCQVQRISEPDTMIITPSVSMVLLPTGRWYFEFIEIVKLKQVLCVCSSLVISVSY